MKQEPNKIVKLKKESVTIGNLRLRLEKLRQYLAEFESGEAETKWGIAMKGWWGNHEATVRALLKQKKKIVTIGKLRLSLEKLRQYLAEFESGEAETKWGTAMKGWWRNHEATVRALLLDPRRT